MLKYYYINLNKNQNPKGSRMARMTNAILRTRTLATAAVFVFALFFGALSPRIVSAGQILDRSLMVSSTQESDITTDGAGSDVSNIPGHPNNGTMVDHTYTFRPYTVSNLRSFTLEYCDGAFGYLGAGPCATDPNGFDASAWNGGVAVVSVNGINPVNYTVTSTSTNYLTLISASQTAIAATTDLVTVVFAATTTNHFQNPNSTYVGTGAGQNPTGTYFARINTYSDNAAAVMVDEGTVTNNVMESISIYTRVQEVLNFSVEGDDAGDGATAPGTACDPLTASGSITIGDSNFALASNTAYYGKSYFRLSTNSSYGTNVFYSGNTLTSGATAIIDPVGTVQTPSTPGTEQFGMAFDPSDSGGSIFEGNASALASALEYDNSTVGYAFDVTSVSNPVVVAASTDVVECETGALKYVANISGDSEAGIYTTKINYIAAPSY